MITRSLHPQIEKWLFRGKVLIVYGSRQVGKTTLVKNLLKEHGSLEFYFNCEVPSIREIFESREPTLYRREFGENKLIVLDEAQYIPEIGRILKIIADEMPDIQVIATGSSSFELAKSTGEPLTGRALTFLLFPLSYRELSSEFRPSEMSAQLESRLRFGMYPEIVLADNEESRILLEDLTTRYLYKDIFVFENLRKSEFLHKLLQLLAFQIGSEVSYHELAKTLKVNERTVMRYIDLLEKAFVLFRLSPFSRNLGKEIRKKNKIYFYDVGVRNSIIRQFQPLALRQDKGALWENYLIVERLKYLQFKNLNPAKYFWRTHDHQEIDYLEEADGQISAYEIKWKASKKLIPAAFAKAYPNAKMQWFNRNEFEDFIS